MLQTGKACLECGTEFTSLKKNKKYCTRDCATKATNRRLLQNYHNRRAEQGKPRVCASCPSVLSVYNPDTKCSSCQSKEKDIQRVDFLKELGLFDYTQE